MNVDKKELIRWCGWFFIGNLVLFWALGLNYLYSAPWLASTYLIGNIKLTLNIFLIAAYVSQLSLLAIVPTALILLLVIMTPKFLLKKRTYRYILFTVAILGATLTASLLLADAYTYHLFHFHLPGIVWHFIFNASHEDFFNFSAQEGMIGVLSVLGLFCVEVMLALAVSFVLQRKSLRVVGMSVGFLVGFSAYLSFSLLHTSIQAQKSRVFFETARVLPLYAELLRTILPTNVGRLTLDRAFEVYVEQPAQPTQRLHYPLKTLQFARSSKPFNIVMIVIDTWRFDTLHEQIMPNVFQLSKKSSVFTQHFSGGNATGPGIFSLFYGLPATYWTSMKQQRRGPVLIDALMGKHYQMNILASGGLVMPQFDQTVFAAINDLSPLTSGKDPHERDLAITNAFKTFIQQKKTNHQPFFSFLFYDSTHAYCSLEPTSTPFKPAITQCDRMHLTNTTDPIPYLNRYKNTLHWVDARIGEVIDALKTQHLMDDTVIVVTGDHGEEFNDHHLNYWGHSSNFTAAQVQTPLVVYWPGRQANRLSHHTTHFDIAPTIMRDILGCKTPAASYSLGRSLWDETSPAYQIVTSYIGLGVIEPSQITTIYPSGDFQITTQAQQPLSNEMLHLPVIYSVLQDLKQFYAAR